MLTPNDVGLLLGLALGMSLGCIGGLAFHLWETRDEDV